MKESSSFLTSVSKRMLRNDASHAAIYPTRKLRLDTFKKIGEPYKIDNDETAKSVVERMKNDDTQTGMWSER